MTLNCAHVQTRHRPRRRMRSTKSLRTISRLSSGRQFPFALTPLNSKSVTYSVYSFLVVSAENGHCDSPCYQRRHNFGALGTDIVFQSESREGRTWLTVIAKTLFPASSMATTQSDILHLAPVDASSTDDRAIPVGLDALSHNRFYVVEVTDRISSSKRDIGPQQSKQGALTQR